MTNNNNDNNKQESSFKNFDLPYKITEQEILDNPKKVKSNFIGNLNEHDEFRKHFWEKLYTKKYYRKGTNLKRIDQAEAEWVKMSDKDKSEWYDWFTDGEDNTMFTEMLMIQSLVYQHKGNMKKVFADLKVYGKEKKAKAEASK